MHRAAGHLLVPLRHERHREVLLVCDLPGRVLRQDVAVGLLEEVAILGVQLLLAAAPLPLRALHRHAATIEGAHDRSDERLLLRSLKDVVVLDVAGERIETLIVLPAGRFIALPEEIELDLGARARDVAHLAGSRDLALEQPPRSDLDRLAARLGRQVAQNDRGFLEPRRAPMTLLALQASVQDPAAREHVGELLHGQGRPTIEINTPEDFAAAQRQVGDV